MADDPTVLHGELTDWDYDHLAEIAAGVATAQGSSGVANRCVKGHVAPDENEIADNCVKEPEGERIRAELIDFLKRNKIVDVYLDTDELRVEIDSVKLPPEIKPVLTMWGSIYVRNEPADPTPQPGAGEVEAIQASFDYVMQCCEGDDDALFANALDRLGKAIAKLKGAK